MSIERHLNASRQKEKQKFGMHFKASNNLKTKKQKVSHVRYLAHYFKTKKSFIQYREEKKVNIFFIRTFMLVNCMQTVYLSFWGLPVSKRDISTSGEHLDGTIFYFFCQITETQWRCNKRRLRRFPSCGNQSSNRALAHAGSASTEAGNEDVRLRWNSTGRLFIKNGSTAACRKSTEKNWGIHSKTLSHCLRSTRSSLLISIQLHAKLLITVM